MAVGPFEHIGVFLILPAKSKAVLLLLTLGCLENLQGFFREGECPAAAGVLRFVLGDHFCDLRHGVSYGHGLGFKVDTVPLKPQKLATAKSVQGGDFHQGEQFTSLQSCEQVPELGGGVESAFIPHILGKLHELAGICGNQLVLHRKIKGLVYGYAIKGVEFSILKVADIVQFSESTADGRTDNHVEVLYGINKTVGADFLKALGLENGAQLYANSDKLDETKYFYQSDVLINALASGLEANSTTVKNALEKYMANNGGVKLAPTDAYGKTQTTDLDLGLYLCVETAVPEMVVSTVNPFLVSLPMTSVNGSNATDGGTRWIYDVTMVILTGVAFGAEAGFMVGAMTMFCSNVLFGQGPWTPWQMFAMGIMGLLAGICFRKGILHRERFSLSVFGGLVTFLIYGGIMNPASVLMYQPNPDWQMILTAYITGVPADAVHALATVLFLWFLSKPMLEKLDRVKVKCGLVER